MFMFRNFHVKQDERALLLRKGDFVDLLGAGTHRYFDPLNELTIEKFSLAKARFEHRLADVIVKTKPELVAREFDLIELGATEVGLRYEKNVLVEVLAPSTRALFVRGFVEQRFERIDIAENFAVPRALVSQFVTAIGRGAVKIAGADGLFAVQVPQNHVAPLFVDGKLDRVLEAGVHHFFRFIRELRTDLVDQRLQVLEVAGQEILTRDKVTLRVNLTAGFRLADPVTAFAKHAKPTEYLYKELQFALRAAVGTRSLDELLEDKRVLDQVVDEQVKRRIAGTGLELESVGVKDIILPGEMKTILAKVVEAEKVAQANVIRRREETAATRSLLNTAQVMEKNPTALRLKELEALEKVAEKIDKISVFGGLDGLLNDLVKLRG